MIKKVFNKKARRVCQGTKPQVRPRLHCTWIFLVTKMTKEDLAICISFLKKMIKMKVGVMKMMEREKIFDDFWGLCRRQWQFKTIFMSNVLNYFGRYRQNFLQPIGIRASFLQLWLALGPSWVLIDHLFAGGPSVLAASHPARCGILLAFVGVSFVSIASIYCTVFTIRGLAILSFLR